MGTSAGTSQALNFAPGTGAPRGRWVQLYLGLGTTTLATLILELSLTRIFSVVFLYHFAFLAISIALFGLGAGGVFSYVVAARGGNLFAKLGSLSLANGLCVVAVAAFILSRPSPPGHATLALVYLASALPFFLAGTVVSIAIAEAMERVDRAYFFDLAGASAGCLLLIPFLDWFGGANTVIAGAALYSLAGVVWFHRAGSRAARNSGVALVCGLAVLMGANSRLRIIDIHAARGRALPPESFTAWNSFSRVGVLKNSPIIVIDAGAEAPIAQVDWDRPLEPDVRFLLLHQGPGLPYALRSSAKALIIGAGGGRDVARALAGGSRDISAVEINPIIANTIMRDKFRQQSHGIYLRPEVRVVVEDGRSFVRRSAEKYDVVQATLVDTWAATAAGAFALSENNLYTTDAFYDYLSHLTDRGLLSFSRWGFDPPRESLRVVSLAMNALARMGVTDARQHLIVARTNEAALESSGALDTILISRSPFTADDVALARQLIADGRADPVYLPGDPPSNPFGALAASSDPQAFFRSYPYDVSPVGDDRPFFFYTVQPRDLWNFLRHANHTNLDFQINRAVPVIFGLVGVSLAATAVVLLLPRWLLGARLGKKTGASVFLTYFLCLGAGYILIQVALLQDFVLLLGHPAYALTVVVFSMLVSSGLGSYFSGKFVAERDSRLSAVLFAIALSIGALAIGVRPLVTAAATWPLAAKILITALCIAPAAFLMGMPFPSGLRRLEERAPHSVRWAWSLNAAASVLGSTGAILLAIYLGLRATLLVGGLLYLCALAVILATPAQINETQ